MDRCRDDRAAKRGTRDLGAARTTPPERELTHDEDVDQRDEDRVADQS